MPAVVFAPVSLLDYQIQLPNSVVVGYQSATGILYSSLTGLRDLPQVRTGDLEKGSIDGMYPGLNLLGLRSLVIQWDTTGALVPVETALQTLSGALQSVPDPTAVVMTAGDYLRQQAGIGAVKPISAIAVKLPGRTYSTLLFGRPVKHALKLDQQYQFGQAKPTTQWDCPDGAIYDFTTVTGTCGLPSPTSGLTWGSAFPWSWGSSTGGSFTLNNTGSYYATPYFVVKGPCTNPIITNQATGQYIALNITLAATDVLTVDTQSGVVTLNQTATAAPNRNGAVRVGSTYFRVAAGTTTIGFSSSDSTAVTGSLTGYLLPTSSTI